MSEETQLKSVQIFQFPVGGRAALTARRAAPMRAVDLMPALLVNVASGNGWYHEDAIREAEQAPAPKH
jgi:uncharacterized protein DUF2735